MIRIVTIADTEPISDDFVREYTRYLLDYFLREYSKFCANGSIRSIGVIFVLESWEELKDFERFGLTTPILYFEWLNNIGNGFYNACVVIDNNRSINIIGKQEYFNKYTEEISHERNS